MKQAVYDPRAQCHGKRCFATYSEAQRNTFPSDDVYRCPHCQSWHISGSPRKRGNGASHRSQQLYTGFNDEGPEAA